MCVFVGVVALCCSRLVRKGEEERELICVWCGSLLLEFGPSRIGREEKLNFFKCGEFYKVW